MTDNKKAFAYVPEHRRDVFLYKDCGEVVIVNRDHNYLVCHVQNARWFTTDLDGAKCIEKYYSHMQDTTEDFPCSRFEHHFLNRVNELGFFTPPLKGSINSPSVVCLSVTEKCNLACGYCFYSASPHNKDAFHSLSIPEKSLKKFMLELKEINPNARVYLTGGEPFVNRDIDTYFRIIKDVGLYVAVVTNATLITKERVESMKDIGVDEVRVSIDGASEEKHDITRPASFKKVMSALELLRQYNMPVILSVTMTSLNKGELKNITKIADQFGFSINYSPAVPTGRASENMQLIPDYVEMIDEVIEVENSFDLGLLNKEASQGLQSQTCGLAGSSLYLDLKGNVAPCNMLHKTGNDLGNVFKTSLNEVLSSNKADQVRVTVDKIPDCMNCYIRYICGGPCRAASLFATGEMANKEPHCALKYSETIESMLREAPKLYMDIR